MAALKTNKWYNFYLTEVEAGRLVLPPYEKNEDSSVKIYYGELFCRVEDCSKANRKFSATNNLHTHLKGHQGVKLTPENKGGRVKQATMDVATKFYKSLFGGNPPGEDIGRPVSSGGATGGLTASKPKLPLKKKGIVHLTRMREIVRELDGKIPCESCENRNSCCKDINVCDHFALFDCGGLVPKVTEKPAENEQAAIEAQLDAEAEAMGDEA
ncbi:hypothetical protein PISL3812_10004 [Talaromyces islandicus]|uniref:Uncharacterized protein n=1 Tax=Talaromyces islandicus TaxID=28573 RepID=A0A0U1MBD7_TALIS|nr:hypothetical protein PISL3812_10004 [Talaromyces islandicus]